MPAAVRDRAPSTLGTFLRSFTFGHVRQLDAVARELLGAAWAAGAGPAPGADVFVGVDSTICEVYGVGKQGAACGYKMRGYHPLLATSCWAPAARRKRRVWPRRGQLLTETLSRAAGCAAGRRLRPARPGDAARRRRVLLPGRGPRLPGRRRPVFSHRADESHAAGGGGDRGDPGRRMDPDPVLVHRRHLRPPPRGTPLSGAHVAEVSYYAFAGTADAIDGRLVVRRVRSTPGSQLALVEVFDHHAFITDRAGELLTVEAEHRDHVVVEQVIRRPQGRRRVGPPALQPVRR